jgi:sugar phosphate isomerase/epimerase
VKTILVDAGLEAAAVSTYIFTANRDSGGPDRPDTRNEQENVEELKRWVDLASDLGAPNVRLFGGALTEGETHDDALPRVARIMAAGAAVNPDVHIALETHDVWNTGAIVSLVLEAAGHANCRALWDVAGPHRAGEEPEETLRLLRPERIAYLHVKDCFRVPDAQRPYHCFIGAGEIPVCRIVQLLKEADWSGYLDVEWEGIYNDYMPDAEAGMAQGVQKLRQYLAE